MMEFLDKFEKRMEWIGIVESIVNRKGKNTKLEGLFSDNELVNIIISVLLFIMEKTLEEDNQCDMQHIEIFLKELLEKYYNKKLNETEIKELAGYIIKDILQNNGERYIYTVKNYSKNSIEEIPIRLIADKIVEENGTRKIIYMLTNQGYDFLFRTREVDEEIQLTLEQLKLKEYVKRKKFSKAVRQSIDLVKYVRQKKKDIENFIISIRQNIYNVDIEKYEQLINSTYAVLKEEYETMNDIQKMIRQAEEKIHEEIEEFKGNEELEMQLAKSRLEIQEIHHNIGVAIREQRNLIINRHNLTDLYMETIQRSFEYSFEKRYDFEKTILRPLEKYNLILDECIQLLKPLFLPKHNKLLGIDSIYDKQIILKGFEEDEYHIVKIEELDDDRENERIEEISERYIQVTEIILKLAYESEEIYLSQIVEKLKEYNSEKYKKLSKNRLLFSTALKFYDLGDIYIKSFFSKPNKVKVMPSEEFNLEYCLVKLQDKVEYIKNIVQLKVSKTENEIIESVEYEENGLFIREEIRMSDLNFKVVK